jgi:levansucrase
VRWTREHLDRLIDSASTTAPAIHPSVPLRVLPQHDIWDPWPVQDADGSPTVIRGSELWMALSAPATGHPEQRHDHARIRLFTKTGDRWQDLGPVFADGTSLGSREWSGCAVRRPDGTVSVFYTAAGRRGEARPTFHQRVIEARPRLITDRGTIQLDRYVEHREVVRWEGTTYLPADEEEGRPGRSRAFRDPGWFRDPADGCEYLLVAASVPWRDRFTGAVALARATAGDWTLLPPLVVADGINYEMERPHVVVHDSRYYLFFSTSRVSFHPPNAAPTGLYGFVARTLAGPYEPLNGSGLVLQNPPAHPEQTYAWLVFDNLRVVSFVNYVSGRFGGTVAPTLHIALDGPTSSVVA